VQKGLIRRDLLYRMDVISLPILPLRKRLDDIPFLAKFILKQESKRTSRLEFDPETIEALIEYNWPGNVRELKSVVSKAAIFAKSDVIKPDDLPPQVSMGRKLPKQSPKTLNLLNNLPSGKQMVNIGPKSKEASNPKIANLL
jgi:DNA-binding NtrC family response regulator